MEKKMQRKSEELQLAVQEYLDVDWSSVKYYLRRQIAKCVQECKSQASNAKKIVGHMKHSRESHQQQSAPNGGYESDDDFDDWDSDFDETDEEAENDKPVELNNNTALQPPPDPLGKLSNTSPLSEDSIPGKFIPKPPDLPVISQPINGNAGIRSFQTVNNIPRPPFKRPPSQPPPPPVVQASSHSEPQEEYEIPIHMQSCSASTSVAPKDNCIFANSFLSHFPPDDSSVTETYEFIEPPEENYEMVDAPASFSNLHEKPVLPPRSPLSTTNSPPPPLPQKPKKLQDSFSIQERSEGVRTFSRPKLPIKNEEESHVESNASSSVPSIGSVFFNSLLGRKSSATTLNLSPKVAHQNKDDLASSSNLSTVSSNEGQSSRSCSPEKDALIPVGGSSFLNVSTTSSEAKKFMPPPPLPPRSALSSEETAQNMATRPLPPVPTPKPEEKTANIQQEVHLYPWFHEIERQDAEFVVRSLIHSGSFVVRPSKRAGKENPYSLTVLHEGKLFHLNIRLRPDNSFALGKEKPKEKSFQSVDELISYHQSEPIHLTSRGEAVGQTILTKYPDKS